MTGRSWARKAAITSRATTARLTAPMMTGLRSRKGFIGVPSTLFGGATRRRRASWGDSSEITPVAAGAVVDRDGLAARQPDPTLEVAEVEVEPGAVRRRPADLVELDREHLQGAVQLGLPAVEVGGEPA